MFLRLKNLKGALLVGLGLLLAGMCLDAFGLLKPDADERFVQRHYAVYRVKRFLHLTRRDQPLLHQAVSLVCGERWSQRFCGEAYRERQSYEGRLDDRVFHLSVRSADSPEFRKQWAQLDLPGYSRLTLSANGMRLKILVLPRYWPAIERLIADYDSRPNS